MKRVKAAEAVPRASERERAAIELIESSGAIVKRTARRYSLCADDADDAYQRALEILLMKAPTTDPQQLVRWMHTVTKHEALAVRRNRERLLSSSPPGDSGEDTDPVDLLPALGVGPADTALSREHIARSSEALHALKPQEVRTLILKAEGYSYAEICKLTGWTFTKVNRCMAEGRKRFLEVYESIEEGRRCDELSADLSAYCDGEADGESAEALRRHLRSCASCLAKAREYRRMPERILGLLPLAAPATGAWWGRITGWMSTAQSKVPQGGETIGISTSAATSGGTRGIGIAAIAKILAVCGATAAGGAACVATGALPVDLGQGRTAKAAPNPGPRTATTAASSATAVAQPDPSPPEQQTAPQPEEPAPPPPPPPVEQEFAPTGTPVGASGAGGGGGRSAGTSGGGGSAGSGAGAEFGP